jgi:hypothetical protein
MKTKLLFCTLREEQRESAVLTLTFLSRSWSILPHSLKLTADTVNIHRIPVGILVDTPTDEI